MTASLPDSVLLPYQKAWIEDQSELKIAEKSRRTGLTWGEAADAVLTASAAKSAGGTNHFYVGSNKEMAIEFIDACAMWARAFDRAASTVQEEVIEDEDKDILTFNIRFSSGYKIQALSSRPSNLRGRQGNVTIDEAAFHAELAEVLKAALALTMWGSKVRLISTHNGAENLFNELIQDSRAGKKRYSVHRLTLDDACDQGLYQRICQVRGKPWSEAAEKQWKDNLLRDTATREDALEEYYCVPKSGGGAYLSRGMIEARMVEAPVVRFEGTAEFNAWPEHLRQAEVRDWCESELLPLLQALNPEECHCFGEDFGRSGDLTVIAPMAISQQLKRRVPFLVELRNVPFKQQEQILYYIVDRLPGLQYGALDARGNGQYLAEQAQYEYGAERVEAVMLSQAWYLDAMPRFKAAFEDDGIEIPRDSDVLDDLRALQVIKGIPKLPDAKTGEDKKRHGDAAIALALAYYASFQQAALEYGYEAIRTGPEQRHPRPVRATAGFRNRGGLL
ncbi:terminase large subunit domain-containing protein [Marinobacter subterrani]|uniref:Mu-like prophage FluMu protein gp28 n=1 Tax=Marinobacter subterrani TaxID=1658765 RepID=A0A0J7J635_9GAMM|nr:terminase family protein [Marinobacter subterrani]KMQ74013.1 Mu-like prophage FluMu protein gp28 [Marinobacter subterrani]